MSSYALSLRVARDYEVEHHVSPEEAVAEKLSVNHLDILVIPENDREHILESAPIDSPEAIVTGISI